MNQLTEFVCEHLGDDVARLIMNRGKYPDIDMDLAVNSIESRRKLRGKVQEWYDEPRLIFPRKLSAEQCSSSATGRYKAHLAEKIIRCDSTIGTTKCLNPLSTWKLADLTGGLGVDSWFFSQSASEVMYCEMLPELCHAARHNFSILGAENISVVNVAVHNNRQDFVESDKANISHTPTEILEGFCPDIIYMDPARRGDGGKKVFLIEDCTPDVLTLKEELFTLSRHLLIKLSPMADISMVCERLGTTCREVHVVSAGGECKELLVWMDREWDKEYSILAVELHKDQDFSIFSFLPSEEREVSTFKIDSGLAEKSENFLFEPGKALMKAGAFNLVAKRFDINKLGRSTHYYTFEDAGKIDLLKGHGKVFCIIRCEELDKRSIKTAGKEFPHSEVTARNIPMDTETLRKKMGVTSGDDAHIFGLKSDSEGNLLLITKPLR